MGWKPVAGKLLDAWLDYPNARRRISAIPSGRPIFITGAYRTGTTWFAGMLAASGVWYVHEPYASRRGRWPEAFLYRRSSDRWPEADVVIRDVLAGRFRSALNLANSDHPLMPLRLIGGKPSRILIKDPLACLLTEYLTTNFGLQTVVLARHPGGVVASLMRLGWPRGKFLRRFVENEALMQDHLSRYSNLLERHVDKDDIVSTTVLYGALTVVLWNWVNKGIVELIQFEEFCRNPLIRFRELFDRLDLPYNDYIGDRHRELSVGSKQATSSNHPHAITKNSAEMADVWRKRLTRTEQRQIRTTWSEFQVPLYQGRCDWSE